METALFFLDNAARFTLFHMLLSEKTFFFFIPPLTNQDFPHIIYMIKRMIMK